jgi:hypothetical protein
LFGGSQQGMCPSPAAAVLFLQELHQTHVDQGKFVQRCGLTTLQMRARRFHEIIRDRVKIIPDELSQGVDVFLLSGARRPPTLPPRCLKVEGDGPAERG